MGDAELKQASDLFAELKKAYETPSKSSNWKDVYAKLRVLFVKFPCFLPPAVRKELAAIRGTSDISDNSPQAIAALTLIRESLEYAVLLAAREVDMETFTAASQQLLFFYGHAKSSESERRPLILGLVLLGMLVRDDEVAFVTFLESLSEADRSNIYIRDLIGLERNLSSGTYTQLIRARSVTPSNDYLPFLDSLITTARRRIAASLEACARSVPIAQAASFLLITPPAGTGGAQPSADAVRSEVIAFATGRGWTVEGDRLVVPKAAARGQTDPLSAVVDEVRVGCAFTRVVSVCIGVACSCFLVVTSTPNPASTQRHCR